MKYISIAAFVLFSFLSALAQEIPSNYCGTDELSPEQEFALKEFQQNLQPWMLEQPDITYYLPIQFHIVGNDDGSGMADLSLVLESICNVNDIYSGSGLQFYVEDEINYIRNSSYFDHEYQDGHLMMVQNNVGSKINVYVVLNAAGNCGYFNPGADAVAINKGCMIEPTTTLAHELGHYLGLPHTFDGWEGGEPVHWKKERADGSNCKVAGDGFCDTPADYLAERWSCPYTGDPLVDPVGDTLDLDPTQIMSYSSDVCQTQFSDEQKAAMRNFVKNYRQGMAASFVPYNGPVNQPSLISPIGENDPVPENYAVFEWVSVPKAVGYQVQISRLPSMGLLAVDEFVTDTFLIADNLQSGLTYYWHVRPMARRNTCTEFTANKSFLVGQPTGLYDLQEQQLEVFPNPVSSEGSLQITLPQVSSTQQVEVQLMDLSGRLHQDYYFQGNNASLSVRGLTQGVYFLRIITDDMNAVRKIVID